MAKRTLIDSLLILNSPFIHAAFRRPDHLNRRQSRPAVKEYCFPSSHEPSFRSLAGKRQTGKWITNGARCLVSKKKFGDSPEKMEEAVSLPHFAPMRLASLAEPFDHPDWIYELKHDGWRCHVYGE